ncbi:MAG: succinylglutamate desuccinylase/aspartoacylase family protein [Burkholderiales bacterium]|nr:MAG: succinylglutamate desuccinylase/aspartoacylase family protein [Burkholderiales bacterium]
MSRQRRIEGLRVGTARAAKGQVVRGELRLGDFPDAPIVSPVMIAAGRRQGPVLWVQGCVHGTEVGGPLGIVRFLKGLDLSQLSGAIVGVMLANPNAFRLYSRSTPLDGENLNRVFPGARNAGHSYQAADLLMRTAHKVADAVLDLHSGGDRSHVPYYALYRDDGSETSRQAARLARSAGSPDVWGSKDAWLSGAMFTHMTSRGVPGLIVECGGAAQVPEEHIDSFVTAIRGVAQAMGIVPGAPPTHPRYRHMDTAELVYTDGGGLFLPAVAAGDVVRKGQALGQVVDLYGDVVETVTSPIDDGWIGSIRRRYMPVYSGDIVSEVMHIVEDR